MVKYLIYVCLYVIEWVTGFQASTRRDDQITS